MDKGAHFHRCDFQVHTPRDLNWVGQNAQTPAERRAFAEELIAACRQKELDAIAVTDHHDVALIPYIVDAAASETDSLGNPLPAHKQVVVFPGMELTLGVPCQALLLLDADFPTGFLEQVVQALSVMPAPAEDNKHAQTERLGHITDLSEFHKLLSQKPFLRDRFIIMPHVGEGGTSTILRAGFAQHYKTMPCVGGYLEKPVTSHGTGNAEIVAGRNREWGNKAIGIFQTSDNRRRDFANLGKHTTWVKWARPTAEALRQACLARESRITHNPPQLPSTRVLSVEVSMSRFMGPIFLELNPQYSALIGGRGTGKSTILEYLRWALCDQSPAIDDDTPEFQKRSRSLIAHTLIPVDGVVTVAFEKNGISHTVRRKSASNELLLKIGDAEYQACTEVDIRTLLPVHGYSQKQLSSVGVRLDQLTRFVNASIQQDLTDLAEERADLQAKLRLAYDNVARHRDLSARIAKHEIERTSSAEQIEQLRASLQGLSDADRAIISSRTLREEEARLVDGWAVQIAEAVATLQAAEDALLDTPLPLLGKETPEQLLLESMRSDLSAWATTARADLSRLRNLLPPGGNGLAEYQRSAALWEERRRLADAEYEAAKVRGAAHDGTLKQIREVEERVKKLDADLMDLKRTLARLGEPVGQFEQLRAQWTALHSRRTQLLAAQCDALTTLSQGQIRATLKKGHNTTRIEAELRDRLKGTKVRAERYEALWGRLRGASDAFGEWQVLLEEFEQLARVVVEDEAAVVLPSTPLLEACGVTIRERQAIARQLTPATWITLFVQELEDEPVFEYRARETEYIPFNEASAGQQATALLHVLLNQEGPPLIIDQPEDDLDNKVMEEVVRELWRAKSQRQLIFASHNANLVVNGDAELVVCCDYRVAGEQSGGHVKLQGAIDIPEVNAEITAVMEGGRAAFKLRREKYGF